MMGSLGGAQVEPEWGRPFFIRSVFVPEPGGAFGFPDHDAQRRQHGGRIGWTHAGAENKWPRMVLSDNQWCPRSKDVNPTQAGQAIC